MESLRENEQIERYLDRLSHLFFVMPDEEAADIRQELRQHLMAMTAEQEARGLSVEEATDEALRLFGDPQVIGKETLKAWFKKHEAVRTGNVTGAVSRRGKRLRSMSLASVGIWSGMNTIMQFHSPLWFWTVNVPTVIGLGAILGLLNELQRGLPGHMESTGFSLAKRSIQRGLPPLPEEPSLGKRLFWLYSRWIMSCGKRMLERQCRPLEQRPPPFDIVKLITRVAVLGIVFVLPTTNCWLGREFVSLFVLLNTGWLGEEMTMRVVYTRHRAN